MEKVEINSLQYWENRFQNNWDKFQGSEQTEFFAHIACKLFPDWLVRKVRSNQYSICDMGCAFGDGVSILSQFFGYAITGTDFSQDAIKVAKDRYPNQAFFTMDLFNVKKELNFDISFLSNVLEHFTEPWNILSNVSQITNKYMIVMVPFEETMIVDEHVYKFNTELIPLQINQFKLVSAHSMNGADMEPTYYADKQIMLIYSACKEDYQESRLADLLDNVVTNNHTTIQNLFTRINESLQKEKELLIDLNKKSELIIEFEKKELSFVTMCKDYELQLSSLQKQLSGLELEISNLKMQKLKLRHEKNVVETERENLKLEKKWLEDEKEQLRIARENLEQNLLDIKNSFSWRSTKIIRVISKVLGFAKLHQKIRSARVQVREGNTWKNIFLYKIRNSILYPFLRKMVPTKLKNKLANQYHATFIPQIENKTIKEELVSFCQSINKTDQVIVVYSGVQYVDSEGQRNIRLVHEAMQMGIKIIFVYWRWDKNEPITDANSQMIQIPIDIFISYKTEFFEKNLRDVSKKVLLVEFPHESAVEIIDIANCFGYTTIYDVIDDWEEFSKKGQAIWYRREIEIRIANQVDINIATAARLKEKISKNLNNKDFYYLISNGVDPSRMKKSEMIPEYDIREGDLQIGYFGHLTDAWFDWEMLKKLANHKPNWTFHLIGYGAPETLVVPDNIKLYGKKEPAELPKYAAYWDVAMIPFINCELTLGVNPIKIYEYLQLGLPTVASNMPEVKRFPYTQIAIGEEEFERAILNASKMKLDKKVIDEFISCNTWKNKLEELLKCVQEADIQDGYKQIF